MRVAQQEYDWNLNFAEIAQIWREDASLEQLQKITEVMSEIQAYPTTLR